MTTIVLLLVMQFFLLPVAATSLKSPTANLPTYANVDPKKLLAQAPTLKKKVLTAGLTLYRCAMKAGAVDTGFLTLIDFTKPSNEKRLWVIDLPKNKVLHHTLVAHGVGSGGLYATKFSNKPKSRKSSIGLFETLHTYEGKHGKSLRLKGHDKGFNDKMESRSIVMHNAWYVSHDFIKKYGRIGRSWGCPAVSKDVSQKVIDTIRNRSQIVAYYPDPNWLKKSIYLHCD